MPINLSIFNYTSPDQILRDYVLFKKKESDSFSIRNWARKLDFKSHSQLHQIVMGKKLLPSKYIPQICDSMGLNDREKSFFIILNDIQRSKSLEEKEIHLKKLENFSETESLSFTEVEEFHIVSDPIHYFILEFISLKNENLSIDDIKTNLKFEYSSFEIRKAINNLLKLNLLIENEKGLLNRSQNHYFNTGNVPNIAIRNYHKNLASLIPYILDKQSVDIREFSGTSFNIESKKLEEMKEDLRSFRESFIQKYAAAEDRADQTYHLNFNLFAVSTNIRKEDEIISFFTFGH